MVLASPGPLLTPPRSSSPPKTPHRSYSAQIRSQNEEKNNPPQTVPTRRQVLIFSGHGVLPLPVKLVVPPYRLGTAAAGLFHRTKLNFAGAQRDYFIIMIAEVPVRSYGPIRSHLLE
jgi:hypothetical protein